jgi:hypothetical protein
VIGIGCPHLDTGLGLSAAMLTATLVLASTGRDRPALRRAWPKAAGGFVVTGPGGVGPAIYFKSVQFNPFVIHSSMRVEL